MAHYALYVGNKATKNLEVGLAQGIWGFKESHEGFNNLRNGDKVVLGYDVSHPIEIFGENPPGYPRVKKGRFQGKFKKLVLIEVSRNSFIEKRTIVWNDDIYPYRFNFRVIQTIEDFHLYLSDKPSLSEALRYSATTKGWLRSINPEDWPIEGEDIVLTPEIDQLGWVYSLIHPKWEDWTKIGCTINEQARLQTYHTSVPDRNHKYLSKIRVELAYDSEQRILKSLRERCDKNQIEHSHEWFNIKFEEKMLRELAIYLGIEILDDD